MNNNALITAAMLASIFENNHKDYLDLIQPFVCTLLPSKNQEIDLIGIQQKMETEYGFVRMPIGVLRKIIDKICVAPYLLCQKSNDRYFVLNAYDNTDFRTKRNNIKEDCVNVANALRDYLRNERAINKTVDECTEELLQFYDRCGHHVLKTDISVRSLDLQESMQRYIASFIQIEKEKTSNIYDKILNIARGYMVYRCIYFFNQTEEGRGIISLSDVKVYLDTPLIINLLGYDTELGNQATLDAIELARSLGAKVCVLQHNIEEAQGILLAYAAAYPRIQSFQLQFLSTKGYSGITIRNIADQIPTKVVEMLGKDIEEAPGLGTSSDWDAINTEETIRRYYRQSIQGKEKDSIKEARIENDVRTLSYVLQLRKGDRPKAFDKCKAIVLSDSKTARRATKALYDDYSRDEINVVYSLNDFSCMTWLSSPSPKGAIPETLLLYNAAATLNPSDAVIEKMLKYIDELVEVGTIDDNIAFLLRTHPSVKEVTVDVIGNNADAFTPDKLKEIYNQTISIEAKKIVEKQYEPQLNTLRKTIKATQDKENIAKETLRHEKEKEEKRQKRIETIARNKSQKAIGIITKIGFVLLWIIRLIIFGFFVCSLIKVTTDGLIENINIFTIGNAILTFVGAIDLFIPKMHWGDRIVKKYANKIGDYIYTREINKGKEYLGY